MPWLHEQELRGHMSSTTKMRGMPDCDRKLLILLLPLIANIPQGIPSLSAAQGQLSFGFRLYTEVQVNRVEAGLESRHLQIRQQKASWPIFEGNLSDS